MIEEFKKYVANFNMNLDGIKRKYNHSIRVMNLSIKYAKRLNYTESEIELAGIIGLLHDIGRFEQYQQYQSFNDEETFNHATYGAKILFDEGLITKFTNRKEDYDLIRFAIENHNKLKIEPTNNKRYLTFAKLIRDIDKLDIVYLSGYLKEMKYEKCYDKISINVIKTIKNHKSVNRKDLENENDTNAMTFAFAFDINNDIVLKELKRNFYYFYSTINHDNIFDDIYKEIINYINERIDTNVRQKIWFQRSRKE